MIFAKLMCVKIVTFAFLFQAVMAAVMTLNDETWIEGVRGKSVFVFFDEAENEDCRALDDTWEKLAADWQGHSVGLVARVDCNDPDSEILCDEYGIVSLPLLLYGDPDSPEFYESDDLSYEALSTFAKEHISSPPCNVKNLDACKEKERKVLTELLAKSRDELDVMEEKVDAQVAAIEEDYDTKIAEIQAQYAKVVTEYNNELDRVRKETNYKWLQQVLQHLDEKEGATGDEL